MLSGGESDFKRAYAWLKLVKLYASLRLHDACNIDPTRMRLTDAALTVVLTSTKTTGPEKRHKEVRAFIHRSASLAGCAWLEVGYNLWRSEPLNFKRSHFLPRAVAILAQASLARFPRKLATAA